MKLPTSILLFLFSITIALGQQRKWTLEECVNYAMENNLTIEQYELDLENAKIDKSDALGAMLPDFNLTTSASGNTGLALDPTTNNLVSSTIFSVSGNAGSSLTLFDGLRNVHRLNRAKMNAIANQYRLENLKDDIGLNVANAYLQILSNKESLKVYQAQYEGTLQDLNRTRDLVAAGSVPRGDQLEIEATAANLEQQIVNAENMVLISRINLAQMLQITDYENFDISDETFEVPPSDILNNSSKEIYEKALTFREDIKFSEANVDLANKDLEIAKGAYYPTLSAFVNYNTRYSDQNYDPVTGDLIGFKDQLWLNDGISYGAQINIPIFNGFSVRNSVERSRISVKKAELQLQQDKLTLETNVNQSYVDVKSYSKAYEAALKTLEARRLAYDYSKEKYDAGLMNAFDYSQAQTRVDDAEAQVISAKYNYIFRLKVLEYYFGIPIVLN
ncbi:TolC family protein [Flavobacteriaceae bacterium F89]|uniref:TolC family protein n=1 Tax=Cerina litoralis TaxID=2874477 RepID=A0AAE3EWH9_9FLAO|nr:TolC family protein [Cerina litoralis]MCG2461424.1 TolC family protein [Cerina litoralis]